jgi:hypothetical protein
MISLESFVANGQAAQAAVEKLPALNPTPLLNRSAVRAALLAHAKKTRAHKYTRVSNETLLLANAHLRVWIINHIARLPSMGKTI